VTKTGKYKIANKAFAKEEDIIKSLRQSWTFFSKYEHNTPSLQKQLQIKERKKYRGWERDKNSKSNEH
jgi:hypothetical protein